MYFFMKNRCFQIWSVNAFPMIFLKVLCRKKKGIFWFVCFTEKKKILASLSLSELTIWCD